MDMREQVEFLMEAAAGTALVGDMTLEDVERVARRKTVMRALAVTSWNISRSANLLDIHRNTMTRIMDELGIRRKR